MYVITYLIVVIETNSTSSIIILGITLLFYVCRLVINISNKVLCSSKYYVLFKNNFIVSIKFICLISHHHQYHLCYSHPHFVIL
jgi:hypothetical protein